MEMAGTGMPFGTEDRHPSVDYLLQVISGVLEDLVRAGEEESVHKSHGQNQVASSNKRGSEKNRLRSNQVSKFNGLHPPSISILYYLQRIAKFSGCSNECFVLMLIYIDRLVTKNSITLDVFNVHRLIISAILLSAKFFDDHFYFNPHFAVVGGLQSHEMNSLELEFLFLIEFNLYVSGEEYHKYFNTLAKMAASRFAPNVNVHGAGQAGDVPLPIPLPKPESRLPLPLDAKGENFQLIPVNMNPVSSSGLRANHLPQYHVHTNQTKQFQSQNTRAETDQQMQQQYNVNGPGNMYHPGSKISSYHPQQNQAHFQYQGNLPAAQKQRQRFPSPQAQDQWVHVSPNTNVSDSSVFTNTSDSSFTMVKDFHYTSPSAYANTGSQMPLQNNMNQMAVNGYPQNMQVPMVYQDQQPMHHQAAAGYLPHMSQAYGAPKPVNRQYHAQPPSRYIHNQSAKWVYNNQANNNAGVNEKGPVRAENAHNSTGRLSGT